VIRFLYSFQELWTAFLPAHMPAGYSMGIVPSDEVPYTSGRPSPLLVKNLTIRSPLEAVLLASSNVVPVIYLAVDDGLAGQREVVRGGA
jgi:hypothetical protein